MCELTLVKKAKLLSREIFNVTERSPKKFRFTLVNRMQNLALDIIENIYSANNIVVMAKLVSDIDKTLKGNANRSCKTQAEQLFLQTKKYQLKLVRALVIEKRLNDRLDFSYSALNKIRQLDYFISLAADEGCILKKQRERVAVLLYEVRSMLCAFIRADKKRYSV